VLADVVDHLRCPHCGLALREDGGALRCESGHSFDVARQGYVSLFDGRAARGDTAAMVHARARFLDAGHMEPLYDAVADAGGDAGGCVVDVGAGTGQCLARVLEAGAEGEPDQATPAGDSDGAPTARVGLALDSSKYALRRAARAHPRIGAVACDAWRPLPVRDATAALVLSVFAPRDAGEVARILAPDGMLVAVTPTPRHLGELVQALHLLTVDEGKPERLDEKLAPALVPIDRRGLEWDLSLSRADCLAAAAMGPSAWHRDDLDAAVTSLPEPFATRASVTISRYRPAGA
jgi:SAM-dependent methyltransferase